jgi:hypothetical protein
MVRGARHGYALILGSATVVGLLLAGTAGLFAPSRWMLVGLCVALGWLVAGTLLAFLFFGSRPERSPGPSLDRSEHKRMRRLSHPYTEGAAHFPAPYCRAHARTIDHRAAAEQEDPP